MIFLVHCNGQSSFPYYWFPWLLHISNYLLKVESMKRFVDVFHGICCSKSNEDTTNDAVTNNSAVYGIKRYSGDYTDISMVSRRDDSTDIMIQELELTLCPLKLWQFKPKQLAQHLTRHDVIMLQAIKISELQHGQWIKKDKV